MIGAHARRYDEPGAAHRAVDWYLKRAIELAKVISDRPWVGEIFKRVDPVLDGENAQQLAFAKFSIEATNMLAAVLVATTWAPTT